MIYYPRFKYQYSIRNLFNALFFLIRYNINGKRKKLINLSDENIFFTNYGRTGIRVLLSSFNLRKDAKIGVQVFTCQSVMEAIRRAGFEIIFIDINDDFHLDLEDLKNKRYLIDLLIISHTFGKPENVSSIKEICLGIPVIEDCAHSFGSNVNGIMTGSFFDASVFTFGYGKFPSIGKGGFILLNNQSLKKKFLGEYNNLGEESFTAEFVNCIKNYFFALAYQPLLYWTITLPVIKSLDKNFDFVSKFDYKESKGFVTNQFIYLKNYKNYLLQSTLQNRNVLQFFSLIDREVIEGKLIICNYYILPFLNDNRDLIIDEMKKRRIECSPHFSKAIQWAINYGYKLGYCPNAEIYVDRIFTVPIKFNYSRDEINYVAKCYNEVTSFLS